MENKKISINRGGRPVKEERERATIKLNCWVTPIQNSQLQTQYIQAKAGGKLAFAQFLKQILLTERQRSGSKKDELLLTTIINLQERGRQLEAIDAQLASKLNECDYGEIKPKIFDELEKISQVITQVTTWLYES